MTRKTPAVTGELTTEMRAALSAIGKMGGKTTGPTKARTTEQARKAGIEGARKRWAKHKKKESN